jgi:Flp pilus assembly pilin Flp
MKRVFEHARTFIKQEAGQTLSEYSLILIFIVILCIAAVTLLGSQVIVVMWNQLAGML